jgi:hypothetical protein
LDDIGGGLLHPQKGHSYFEVSAPSSSSSTRTRRLRPTPAGAWTAVGVHPAVGYDDPVHQAPAVLGALIYLTGMALTFRP